jgi:hypothetical protein
VSHICFFCQSDQSDQSDIYFCPRAYSSRQTSIVLSVLETLGTMQRGATAPLRAGKPVSKKRPKKKTAEKKKIMSLVKVLPNKVT